jgi:hypothetical protein
MEAYALRASARTGAIVGVTVYAFAGVFGTPGRVWAMRS